MTAETALTEIVGGLSLSVRTISTYQVLMLKRLQLKTTADIISYGTYHKRTTFKFPTQNFLFSYMRNGAVPTCVKLKCMLYCRMVIFMPSVNELPIGIMLWEEKKVITRASWQG